MSHCTKFDFTYSDEEAIVRAFRKMNIATSNEQINEYSSEFQKKILGMLGHDGVRQMKAICGQKDGINIFMCKIAENRYELNCEHPSVTEAIKKKMIQIGKEFQQAYVEVAVDMVVKKIENSGTPTQVEKAKGKYIINFGPANEYKIVVSYTDKIINEEVFGIKGSFCTALTEDIENILSHPEAELTSEYKEEMDMVVDDHVLQVISLEF